MNTQAAAEKVETVAKPAMSHGALVEVSPRIDAFRQEVLPPDKARALYRSLPSHISPARFERNLVNALMQNPDLMNQNPLWVYREVSKAVGLGLLLDPILGEAYIIIGYNGKTKQKEPQLRVGYKGMCKLARQTGDVSTIYAHEVCEHDRIECHLGSEKRLVHTPVLFGERGTVVGYYAVINFKDGTFDFEPMSVAQCRAIRDRSDAWKAYSAEKIKSTPWSTDEEEMSKKTVLRRLLKRQDQSPELAEAIKIEDEAEFQSLREPSPMRSIEGPPPPPPPPPKNGGAPPPPPAATAEDLAAPARDPAEVVWEGDEQNEMAPEATVAKVTTPPPPPPAQPLNPADASKLKAGMRADIAHLFAASDFAHWLNAAKPMLDRLSPADRAEIDAVFQRRQDEVRG